MPYVKSKTWLQMAPRIKGLSLRESQRGFGSVDLFPATPCLDPDGNLIDCGGSSSGLTVVNDTSNSGYTGLQLPVGTSVAPGGAPATANSLTAWLQANQQTVLLVGAGLFGMVLLTSMMGKR